jgi:hypothetical protein
LPPNIPHIIIHNQQETSFCNSPMMAALTPRNDNSEVFQHSRNATNWRFFVVRQLPDSSE